MSAVLRVYIYFGDTAQATAILEDTKYFTFQGNKIIKPYVTQFSTDT